MKNWLKLLVIIYSLNLFIIKTNLYLFLGQPNADQVFMDAINNPTADESKSLIKKLENLVSIGNSKIPFSQAERKASMKQLYALVDCFALPNFFLTISPDDINHFLTIRLSVNDCFHSGNDFKGIVIADHIIEDKSYFNLYKLHTENPVAVASSFNDMIESLIDILLKGSNADKIRKTKIFSKGGKGLLGINNKL